MVANRPWDGTYNISDTVWITAHTTQFTEIGWHYLGGGACALLPKGGSHVALVDPTGADISIIIETVGAKAAQVVELQLGGALNRTITSLNVQSRRRLRSLSLASSPALSRRNKGLPVRTSKAVRPKASS